MVGAQFLDRSGEPIGAARVPVHNACITARTELLGLGQLAEDITSEELADRVDTETGVLGKMVESFSTHDTGNGTGRDALAAWILDWRRLLDGREAAAEQIRQGERPSAWLPPEEPGKAKAIDGRMDEYARREDVRDCTTDVLEADNLDGQRGYRPVDE